MGVDDLQIEIEPLIDAGGHKYLATSPDLPNLFVAGDSPEEVRDLAPRVAAALLASMQAYGDPLPKAFSPDGRERGEP
jgi:predicted RNase H-like HicB family nuclease